MDLKKTISKLCDPAKFYLFLSIISAAYSSYMLLTHPKAEEHPNHKETINNHTINGLIMQIVVAILWTMVLSWICKMKHGVKVAWFLVFLPILFLLVLTFFALHMINKLSPEDINTLAKQATVSGAAGAAGAAGAVDATEGFCSECG